MRRLNPSHEAGRGLVWLSGQAEVTFRGTKELRGVHGHAPCEHAFAGSPTRGRERIDEKEARQGIA